MYTLLDLNLCQSSEICLLSPEMQTCFTISSHIQSISVSVCLSFSLTGFHYVALGDLELAASAFQVLALSMCAAVPGLQCRSFDFLIILCVWVFCLRVHMCTVCRQCPLRPEDSIRFLGTSDDTVVSSRGGCW